MLSLLSYSSFKACYHLYGGQCELSGLMALEGKFLYFLDFYFTRATRHSLSYFSLFPHKPQTIDESRILLFCSAWLEEGFANSLCKLQRRVKVWIDVIDLCMARPRAGSFGSHCSLEAEKLTITHSRLSEVLMRPFPG